MHVWYVDAGIEDTPELVYTRCLVLSFLYNLHAEGRKGRKETKVGKRREWSPPTTSFWIRQ